MDACQATPNQMNQVQNMQGLFKLKTKQNKKSINKFHQGRRKPKMKSHVLFNKSHKNDRMNFTAVLDNTNRKIDEDINKWTKQLIKNFVCWWCNITHRKNMIKFHKMCFQSFQELELNNRLLSDSFSISKFYFIFSFRFISQFQQRFEHWTVNEAEVSIQAYEYSICLWSISTFPQLKCDFPLYNWK